MNLNLSKSEVESILGWCDTAAQCESDSLSDYQEGTDKKFFKEQLKNWKSIKRKLKKSLKKKPKAKPKIVNVQAPEVIQFKNHDEAHKFVIDLTNEAHTLITDRCRKIHERQQFATKSRVINFLFSQYYIMTFNTNMNAKKPEFEFPKGDQK